MAEQQPFAGITVIEFGQFVSVPFCAQLLAEGGADVVKIEPLEGDAVRRLAPLAPGETRTFISRNRGKRSLPLNLRHPEAAAIIQALLADADVALMNFRPGLAEALGLDAATLVRQYPRLIVGQITPFGRQGPEASLPAMDVVVQARSGLMAANGRTSAGVPTSGDPLSADYMCAMTLAFGIAAALLRRAGTGRGGEVQTSLLRAALTLQNNQMVRIDRVERAALDEALGTLTRLRAAGAPYEEQRAALPTGRPAGLTKVYFRTYRTRDAAIAVGCASPVLRRKFLAAAGLVDSMLEAAEQGRTSLEDHYEGLRVAAEERLTSRSATEWLQLFQEAGIPAASVKFPAELFEDEQTTANGMFHDLDHPSLGPVRVLAPPLALDSDGFQPAPATAAFGSEARAILGELGFAAEETEAFIASGVTRTAPAP